MGFLKGLFGGKKESKPYVDTQGVYLYVKCDNCGSIVRLRADKQYDLERDGSNFQWHKTVVDNRCFRRMPTTVSFDSQYNITHADISGGSYVSAEEYDQWVIESNRQREAALAAAEAEAQAKNAAEEIAEPGQASAEATKE